LLKAGRGHEKVSNDFSKNAKRAIQRDKGNCEEGTSVYESADQYVPHGIYKRTRGVRGGY